MKKALSFFLCLVLLCGFACLACSAVGVNAGEEALIAQFESGEASLDYMYYSPIKNELDTQKYPLVVWLHGNSSGDYPGHQLKNSRFYKWSSEEYQKRFKGTGGAWLLLPRCPTGNGIVAWGVERRLSLKRTINAFVSEHAASIDTSRIYIGGYSMGRKMTLIMASSYPDYFAAAFPMSPVYVPTNSELEAMGQMPIWLFVNENDEYLSLSYNTVVKPNWNYFCKKALEPEKSRFTTFSVYYNIEGVMDDTEVHNTWNAVTNDMFMNNNDPYYGATTVNGAGETVSLTYPDGVISWLSSQGFDAENDEPAASASLNFIQKIIMLIKRLLSLIIVI